MKFECTGVKKSWLDVKMPVWMPGYYQLLNYADNISEFHVTDQRGDSLRWEKANYNTWRIYINDAAAFTVTYNVKAVRNFVATNYLDEERGFIAPPGMFLHVDGLINHPVTVMVQPYSKWDRIATGLEPVKGEKYTYMAPDFDVLYDSPILVGNLEELPSFTVRGVPHYFIGYKPGQFDRAAFMNDLKKVVEAAAEMMGDIPFKHYTFIAIGPGGGGIEHLNSAAVSFDGTGMNSAESRKGVLSFLAHEYFHHYNAKRIRPIELGPFDYDKGSRTDMLWVAEGITSYYERFLLMRAGLITESDLLKKFESHIKAYENKPGRLFQSVAQASYDTWSDGPFGRTGDDVNKTISYYDKGPVLAMMLDFKIRHQTNNKKSLDDVMRMLYKEYYQARKRGYTAQEFRDVCEKIAGVSLGSFFEYVYTVKEVDYGQYLSYAGLTIDTVSNGKPATMKLLQDVTNEKVGSIVTLQVEQGGVLKTIPMILGTHSTRSFTIGRVSNPTKLQAAILSDWMRVGK
ncbi:MAG: M61 family peptidase [Chitinophagaceae bacterium]|nr:MAG: M61 family peptidase [Chitinophagaceae bacterium]